MTALLGVTQTAVYTGAQDAFNGTVRLIKQDINFVDTLDNITVPSDLSSKLGLASTEAYLGLVDGSTLVAKGVKSLFSAPARTNAEPSSALKTLATFSDGKPALVMNTVGKYTTSNHSLELSSAGRQQCCLTGCLRFVIARTGKGSAYYAGFLPGLSYFAPAIPLRPVDRSSVDEGMNHFIPTEFADAAKGLITLPLTGRMNESTVRPLIGALLGLCLDLYYRSTCRLKMELSSRQPSTGRGRVGARDRRGLGASVRQLGREPDFRLHGHAESPHVDRSGILQDSGAREREQAGAG